MPVYGGGEFILEAVRSIYDHDAGVPFNLVLVDDQSPQDPKLDAALAYVKAQDGAHVFRHQKNGGFAATCNTGAATGKSPWILLLNTDIRILHDGWLEAMVNEGDDPEVGVVGALLTYYQTPRPWAPADPRIRPAGKVQHAGVVFDIMRRPYHIFGGWDHDHPKVAQRREMNCVTGACLLTRREIWRRIGGLDTAYTKGNFEDVTYCLMTRMNGHKVVFTPKAHLEHYAGGSENSMTAGRNAQIFQLKMGDYVVYDEYQHW
jgi:GT2 family glycosyltransferase